VKLYPRPTAVPHPWHRHPHSTNARLDVPLGEIAVPDDSLPPLGIASISVLGSQHGNFHLKRLRQEWPGALASDLC